MARIPKSGNHRPSTSRRVLRLACLPSVAALALVGCPSPQTVVVPASDPTRG
jgi:hypothetical protein